jgi:hypothetical protein
MLEALAALLKAALYMGVLSCAGAVFAQATLRLSPESSSVLWQLMRRGAVLTICAVLAGAGCLFLRLGAQVDTATLSAVFLSSVGAAMCLQVAGAALLLSGTDGDDSNRGMQLSNAMIVTASFAFGGHAAANGLTAGVVAFLHVSLAAWWVGSLWVLRDACTRLKPEAVAGLVLRFSALAFGLVGRAAADWHAGRVRSRPVAFRLWPAAGRQGRHRHRRTGACELQQISSHRTGDGRRHDRHQVATHDARRRAGLHRRGSRHDSDTHDLHVTARVDVDASQEAS